jgi:hypothetical protein
MGCDASNPENRQAVDQGQFIDIDLLIRPKPRAEPSEPIPEYRAIDALSADLPRSSSSPSPAPPKEMIDHRAGQSPTPPAVEHSRHERFAECFSLIDANAFHAIPRLSMPWVQPGQPDRQISHEIDEYCRFIDGLLGPLLTPLAELRVKDGRRLAVPIG